MKSIHAREIICGRPTILIYRGKINEKALKKERFTINELEERLRGDNINSLGDVEYAILETSGSLSVIPKPNKRNTIPEDFNIEPEYEGISYDLVIDGAIMEQNLKAIGKDEKWLKSEVAKFGINPKQALVVTFDGKGYRNRTPISQWESLLGGQFVRIHRSYLVRRDAVKEVMPDSVSVKSGAVLPVSRGYKDRTVALLSSNLR